MTEQGGDATRSEVSVGEGGSGLVDDDLSMLRERIELQSKTETQLADQRHAASDGGHRRNSFVEDDKVAARDSIPRQLQAAAYVMTDEL